jgi:peptidyl-tRNA hydrolase
MTTGNDSALTAAHYAAAADKINKARVAVGNDATLYILMRGDMASMNAGKGMAQAAHAANAFAAWMNANTEGSMLAGFDGWQAQTDQNFGTTIVLVVSGEDQLTYVTDAARGMGFPSGVVTDPTYPVRDGAVTHLLPVNTCGYVFTPSRSEMPVRALADLALHP